jgi:hypothetical protein
MPKGMQFHACGCWGWLFGASRPEEETLIKKRPKKFRFGCCGCLRFLCEDPVTFEDQDNSILGLDMAHEDSILGMNGQRSSRPKSFLQNDDS